MATYDNAQLVKMSGLRDPYSGELGVVKEGALADLLPINGNPREASISSRIPTGTSC